MTRMVAAHARVRVAGVLAVAGLLLGLHGVAPAPLLGQSIVAGSLEGTVTAEGGEGLRGAAVSLIESRSNIARELNTGSGGSFAFTFVVAGEYDLRVEALGHRPRLVRGIVVGPGESARIAVEVIPEPPPVTLVDTVAAGAAGTWSGLGTRIGSAAVRNLPDADLGIDPLLALSTHADELGGYQGRPPTGTVLFSEGEPFRPALHPTGAGGGLVQLPFPRPGVSGLDVLQGIEDIEWTNGQGAAVPVRTRPGGREGSGSVWALASGGPLWSSSGVDDPPSLSSLWGGAEVAFALVPDTTILSLAAEGGRVQTAQPASAADSVVALLGGVSPGMGVRELMAMTGQARLDWGLESGGQVAARAGFATFDHTLDRPQVPGLVYGVPVPVSGTDASFSAVVAAPLRDPFFLEVRGSLGRSERDYLEDAEQPGAWLVGSRAHIGTDPAAPARVSRLDVGGGPVLHYLSGPHRLKAGVRLDVASHEYTYVDGRVGEYAYGNVSALTSGRGFFSRASGGEAATSFSVPVISGFGQYRWTAAPGFDVTAGVRYARQNVPVGDVRAAPRWLELSGVPTDSVADKLETVDARTHVLWDVQGDGLTWIAGGMSLQYGPVSPSALAEWLIQDGAVSVRRGFGDVGSWPAGDPGQAAAPVEGTRLTAMGRDLDAPRTVRASASLSRRMSPGLSIGASASFRRSENLLRRRDLNRLVASIGSDQNGRPLFGDLSIAGGVLAADPATNRRFSEFEAVWALDPDGWSEYRAFSVFFDAELRGGARLSADYTYSETTDNLFGEAYGHAAATALPELGVADWEEGTSDFDVPHRAAVTAQIPIAGVGVLAGVYRFRSGLPFTPMVAAGLDANGDGSAYNDPAFIPTGSALDAIAGDWSCVAAGEGALAVRNSCRGDALHRFDMRLTLRLVEAGGVPIELVADGLNLTDATEGVRDVGLVLADPAGVVTASGSTVTVPYQVNPSFGTFLQRTDPGRMFRFGIRIGGGE